MTAAWPELRARWWAGWQRFFPEDATCLGAPGCADRLRGDAGPVGDDERAFHASMSAQLERFSPATLDAEDQLEHETMDRTSRFRAHVLEAADHDRVCLELSLHPFDMIAHHLAHARDARDLADARARIERVPAVLAGREAALAAGTARGRVPDAAIVEVVRAYALPGAARGYRELGARLAARGLPVDAPFADACGRAAAATEAHRVFIERELGPRAVPGAARIGEEDLRARLALTYGEPVDARALRDEAHEAIGLLSARLVVSAARAARARGLRVRDLREASAYVARLFGEHPAPGTDVAALYAELTQRAVDFAASHRLFSRPPSAMGFVPIPAGMVHGGAITNWPAPLLDRSRVGHTAITPDPQAHAVAFMPNLAIHEASPGHFFQSAVWQSAHDAAREPVRFVAVHDDVAMASSWFGAMPAIEGFAVHAEEVLFAAGFHELDAEVAFLASALIRAARTEVDLGLHLRELDVEAAAHRLAEATGMPRGWCEVQVARFLRVPLQAGTYVVGARAHRAMLDAARVREGASFRADAFHDRLLALGPATLTTMARRLAASGPPGGSRPGDSRPV